MSSDLRTIELTGFQIIRGQEHLLTEPLAANFRPAALNLITGENGSGKTTLLDLLALRAREHHGCAVVRRGHSRAREIAYLPQRYSLIVDIRVRHLIDLAARHGRLIGPEPDAIRAKMSKAPRCELGELSGGEQQILLFWLVSSQPVHIFIYDEPLRHLDNEGARLAMEVIEQQVQRGDLVIVSNHSDCSHWRLSIQLVSLILNESSR